MGQEAKKSGQNLMNQQVVILSLSRRHIPLEEVSICFQIFIAASYEHELKKSHLDITNISREEGTRT